MTDKHPRRNNYPQLNEKKHGPTHKSCYLTHTYHILIHSLSSPSRPRYPHPPHCALPVPARAKRCRQDLRGCFRRRRLSERYRKQDERGPGNKTSNHITSHHPFVAFLFPPNTCRFMFKRYPMLSSLFSSSLNFGSLSTSYVVGLGIWKSE